MLSPKRMRGRYRLPAGNHTITCTPVTTTASCEMHAEESKEPFEPATPKNYRKFRQLNTDQRNGVSSSGSKYRSNIEAKMASHCSKIRGGASQDKFRIPDVKPILVKPRHGCVTVSPDRRINLSLIAEEQFESSVFQASSYSRQG